MIALQTDKILARVWHHTVVLKRHPLPAEGPAILVCNHTSGLDPHLIQSPCRRLITWMMAKEYYDLWFLKPVFEQLGVIRRAASGMEQLIGDVCVADPGFGAMLLRYFNPVGAHPSGLIGEDPRGVPDNLMPYVAQVAVGRRERLQVFGDDWPTPDGTGIRDYVHVMDLARAHVAALAVLGEGRRGATALNLGTGLGTSVLDLVQAFGRACGHDVPYEVVGRRAGDVAELWASPDLAREMLGWSAEHDVDAMCRDAWRWQSKNPDGYG